MRHGICSVIIFAKIDLYQIQGQIREISGSHGCEYEV
jgi:hypothetical protein